MNETPISPLLLRRFPPALEEPKPEPDLQEQLARAKREANTWQMIASDFAETSDKIRALSEQLTKRLEERIKAAEEQIAELLPEPPFTKADHEFMREIEAAFRDKVDQRTC